MKSRSKNVNLTISIEVATIFKEIDSISTKCEDWVQKFYKPSTTALYQLLGQIYEIYDKKFLSAPETLRKVLNQDLRIKLNERGLNTDRRSTVLGMLLRYIFNNNRKRVSQYGMAINIAKNRGITPSLFVDWLSESGGIEEVCSYGSEANAKNIKDQKAKALTACKTYLDELDVKKNYPIATVSISHTNPKGYSIMIANPGLIGEYQILAVLDQPSSNELNSVIAALIKRKIADEQETMKINSEASFFGSDKIIEDLYKIAA